MTAVIFGLALWIGAHLFKRVLPAQHAAMGKAAPGMVALIIVAGVVLMVIGYRGASFTHVYALPVWAWYLNNVLMLIAVFLLGVGRAGGVIGAKLRHPMLLGAVVWAVAHLLVNGDLTSIVLFGALGVWAVLQMVIISRAEGPWSAPAPGPIAKDVRVAAVAVILYAFIVAIHYWLGHPVFVFK